MSNGEDEEREGGQSGRDEGAEALRFQHASPDGALDAIHAPELWRLGVADMERVPFGGEGWWENIGPAPLQILGDQIDQGIGPNSGEVLDIAIDPRTDRRVMYIATNSGGVWKTENGGQSWRPLAQLLSSMQIGALALDPGDPDVIYAGTGNLFEGGGGIAKSTGLFKSTDGGETWALANDGFTTASVDFTGINRIVCPASGQVLVATDDGLFFSINGGRDFGPFGPAFDGGGALMLVSPGLRLQGGRNFITCLELDNAATTVLRITAAAGTPIVVTCADHGFQTGDRVYIGGVAPSTIVNGGWLIDVPAGDQNHFSLRGSIGPAGPVNSGVVMGPARPRTFAIVEVINPGGAQALIIRSPAHELITGDVVAVHGVEGAGEFSVNGSWTVRVLDPDRFVLEGSRFGGALTPASGHVDAPGRRRSFAITAAVNRGRSLEITIPGNTLREGDAVRVVGLPGIVGQAEHAVARLVEGAADTVRLPNLNIVGPFAPGATLFAPAVWNHVLYGVNSGDAGVQGLHRLALTSDGPVVSRDLLAAAPGMLATYERIVVAQSLLASSSATIPDCRVLIAAVAVREQDRGRLRVLVVSFDHGRTWISRLAALNPVLSARETAQSIYDLTLGIDPLDPDSMYVALRQLFTSTDAGATWPAVQPRTGGGDNAEFVRSRSLGATLTQLHADHHELVFPPPCHWAWRTSAPFNPVLPTPVIFGTDGGVASTDNGGVTYVSLNEGLETALFKGFDIGRGAGREFSYGGMQDTGTGGWHPDAARSSWISGIAGDGGQTVVDPADANLVYGLYNNQLIHSRDGGATWLFDGVAVPYPILSVANSNPVRVACFRHPFRTGDRVRIVGVGGGANAGNGNFRITVPPGNTREFTLDGVDGTVRPAFERGPLARGARYARAVQIVGASLSNPITITTERPHQFTAADRVHIEGVVGNTAANNSFANPSWAITPDPVDPNVFTLNGSNGSAVTTLYVPRTGRVHGPRDIGEVPVILATNPTAAAVTASGHGLVVTARNHAFVTGETVTIENVRGNTAANVVNLRVLVIDANSFELPGIAGNGVFRAGPTVTGPNLGGGLPDVRVEDFVRIAIVPNGVNPAVRIYYTVGSRMYRSDDGGFNFVRIVNPFNANILAIASPRADQLWIGLDTRAAGQQTVPGEVHFSSDGGAHWLRAADGFQSRTGGRTAVSEIAVDPGDPTGRRVAVVHSGYSITDPTFRTRHVYLTEDRGATWSEIGGTRGAADGNVPDLPVLSAAFDQSTAPSTLYVATDAGVLRWLRTANRWERVGANLPGASCQRIAIDGSAAPSTIRIGTYGRSAFELKRQPTAGQLIVRGHLGFSATVVGRPRRVPVVLHNAGSAAISIIALGFGAGAIGDFTVDSPPALPLTLNPGESRTVNVVFTPAVTGRRADQFEVRTATDTVTLRAMGEGVARGGDPRLSITRRLRFGVTVVGHPGEVTATVENVGFVTVQLTPAPSLMPGTDPAFTIVGAPGTPTLEPGETFSIVVRFDPTARTPTNRSTVGTLTVDAQTAGGALTNVTSDLFGLASNRATDFLATILRFFGLQDDDEAVA